MNTTITFIVPDTKINTIWNHWGKKNRFLNNPTWNGYFRIPLFLSRCVVIMLCLISDFSLWPLFFSNVPHVELNTDQTKCWLWSSWYWQGIKRVLASSISVYLYNTRTHDAYCEGQSSPGNGQTIASLWKWPINDRNGFLLCQVLFLFYCLICNLEYSVYKHWFLFANFIFLFIVIVAVCSCQERFIRMWHWFSWCDVTFAFLK